MSERQSPSIDQNQQVQKQEQNKNQVRGCQYCTKIFTNGNAFETHMKVKHKEIENKHKKNHRSKQQKSDQSYSNQKVHKSKSQSQKKKINSKNSALEQQQNQLEDNIYAYLGQLGQKNIEVNNNKVQTMLQSSDQKKTGQANYSLNIVVRTPYQQPIKPVQFIPHQAIKNSKYHSFLLILQEQVKKLYQKIESERQLWQLRDPMAPDEQTQDQFSLMDIRKMIQNYHKRELNLLYPFFSIFLLWIARICKPPAFEQFFTILGHYLGQYLQGMQNDYLKYENWQQFYYLWQSRQLHIPLKICDEKSCKKLCQFFYQWVKVFQALKI